MVQENLDKLFFVLEIGYLGAWGGGVNYLVYHAPSSLEFKFQNLGTVRGGVNFLLYHAPPHINRISNLNCRDRWGGHKVPAILSSFLRAFSFLR